MNALYPTVAEFRERLKHQRTEKKRRLNAMNCKPNRAVIRAERHPKRSQLSEGLGITAARNSFRQVLRVRQIWPISFAVELALTPLDC